MRLVKMTIGAFKSLRDTGIDFSKHSGLVGVEGRVIGSGADSNGAAKSSAVLDAPCWCLFGKCVQDTDDANSVCNRQTGEADVTVVVELANGKHVTIQRTRRSNKATLTVSGLAGGTVEGKQETVDEMLGIDYQLWTRVIAFGGSASSFCKLGDSEKKAALEKLLGLDDFTRARDNAAEKAKDCRDIVTKMVARKDEAENTRISCADRLVKLQEDYENFSARMTGECFAAMSKLHSLNESLVEGYEQLGELGIEAAAEGQAYEEEYKNWQSLTKQHKAKIDRLISEEKDAASDLAVANSELTKAKQDLKHAQSDDHPDECPTCGQEWVANSSTKSLIQARKNALATALEKHAVANNALSRAESLTQKAKGALAAHEDNEPSMGEKQAAFDSLKNDLELIKSKRDSAQSEYSRMVEQSESNPYLEQLQRCRDDLATAEMTVKTATDKAERATADLALYDFWVAGFGKQGIPSFLIDNSIPFLNEALQRMVSLVTDGGTSVHFDPTIEGGRGSRGGQQLGIVVDNQYGGGSYKTQSTGERARIDICVLLAIRQLMATRLTNSFQQIFLDEVADGLDESGCNAVAALLRAEFPDSTIYVITHDDRLKEHMDQTIVIEKRKGVSRVIKQ
jgi:DNA repair exonuclease SbcCD ATPase subunit